MQSEVLQRSEFPEIEYRFSRGTASGNGDRYCVALKGEVDHEWCPKSMPVSAKVILQGNSLRATGEFSLRQSEFAIVPITATDGTVRVKDEMKGIFDIVARQG